jgi:hypothetical protein
MPLVLTTILKKLAWTPLLPPPTQVLFTFRRFQDWKSCNDQGDTIVPSKISAVRDVTQCSLQGTGMQCWNAGTTQDTPMFDIPRCFRGNTSEFLLLRYDGCKNEILFALQLRCGKTHNFDWYLLLKKLQFQCTTCYFKPRNQRPNNFFTKSVETVRFQDCEQKQKRRQYRPYFLSKDTSLVSKTKEAWAALRERQTTTLHVINSQSFQHCLLTGQYRPAPSPGIWMQAGRQTLPIE